MFTLSVQTAIDIDASAQVAWEALVDFNAYNDWNPMLNNVKGDARLGSPISIEVLAGRKKRLYLNVTIDCFDLPNELTWSGGSLFSVKGTHYFKIEAIGENKVRVRHGERFRGLFLPFMAKNLAKSEPLYTSMNKALKKLLEGA
jgi:hypothetical protein